MSRARIPALLTWITAAFVLTACGVPPSGVVQAGEPATRMPPPLYVYFLAGGRLVAVPRMVSGRIDVATAVRLVFAGPTKAEAAKVQTELPRPVKPPEVGDDDRIIRIHLPETAGHPLSKAAQQQLLCTVAQVVPFATPSDRPGAGPIPTGAATAGEDRKRPRLGLLVSGSTWEMLVRSDICPA